MNTKRNQFTRFINNQTDILMKENKLTPFPLSIIIIEKVYKCCSLMNPTKVMQCMQKSGFLAFLTNIIKQANNHQLENVLQILANSCKRARFSAYVKTEEQQYQSDYTRELVKILILPKLHSFQNNNEKST
ncbi:hypothetical protein Pfo_025160 [Paulownia fortunei]|nr:hypothetical protein Pfo_025160 [Paulownia fortunei]